ncbi:DNA repair protein RecO [Candidatus Falkowbacteria bacterium]|nr:DNA repair protein RecO [Candidatus Falkowbacteria bacterium]
MTQIYKTKGIVLAKKPWREADLLFSIFTEDFGKIKVISAGVRKIKSKLSGQINTPGIVEILFASGRNFKKLTHACLDERFVVAAEPDFYFYAAVLELLDKSSPEDEKNRKIFALAVFTLKKIISENKLTVKKFWLNFFIIKLLSFCGYELKTIEQAGEKNNQRLVQVIRRISAGDCQNLRLRKDENQQLFCLLKNQVQFYLEREICGLNILQDIDIKHNVN